MYLCESNESVVSMSPSLCIASAKGALCLHIDPSTERQTHRSPIEGSSKQEGIRGNLEQWSFEQGSDCRRKLNWAGFPTTSRTHLEASDEKLCDPTAEDKLRHLM